MFTVHVIPLHDRSEQKYDPEVDNLLIECIDSFEFNFTVYSIIIKKCTNFNINAGLGKREEPSP